MTNPCFPLRRAFLLLLNVESVFLFLLSPPKQTYSIDPGYHWSYCIVRLNMNLYIDFIYKISRWKLKLFANTYIFLCVDSQTLLSWNHYLWELVKYVGRIAFMSLTYHLWKVLLEWFNLVIHCFLAINYRQLFCISSKIILLSLTYSRTSRS